MVSFRGIVMVAVVGVSVDARAEETLSREQVVAEALARSPLLAEARGRALAASEMARARGRLPDVELKYEQWGVPLRRPVSLGRADAVMVGLQQRFPAFGALSARERAGEAAAAASREESSARRLDLVARARQAFARYFVAHRELALHRAHADLLGRLLELSRTGYRAGRRSQQDVVRLELEMSRIHGQLAHMEPGLAGVRALVNALMGRSPSASLPPPGDLVVSDSPPRVPAAAGHERPELRAAEAALRARVAEADVARLEANRPSLMVGVDYMYMPMLEAPHTYGAMLGVSLPWFSPGRRDTLRAAEHELRAEESAREAVRLQVELEIEEALAQWAAAHAQQAVLDGQIRGSARRNLEAAEAAYASGGGDATVLVDAARTLLDVEVERVRALGHLEEAVAAFERAIGRDPGTKEGGS